MGGDDSEEYKNMGLGLEANNIVFKEEPADVKIKVETNSIEREKVPVSITVSLGF